MKKNSIRVATIFFIVTIFLIFSIIIPRIVNGDNNDATTTQVLANKTFTSDLAGVAVKGAMKDFSDTLVTKTLAADKKGVSTITLDPGYYDSIQIDASAVYNAGYSAGQSAAVTYRYTFPTTTASGDSSKTITCGKAGYMHLVANWSYGGTGPSHPSNMNGVSLYKNSEKLFSSETDPNGYGHSGSNAFDIWVNKGDYIKISAWEYQGTTTITVTGYLDEVSGTKSWVYN